MIAELFHWMDFPLWRIVDLVLLLCRLWALWLACIAHYVLLDIFVRAALLRGWLGGAEEALAVIVRDPGRLRAISTDQDSTAGLKPPQNELASLLILGDGPGANLLLTRQVAQWPGGVIAIGPHGLSDRIPLKAAVRFCPGARDSVRLNPMLMLQPDPFAWREARILAAGLIGADDSAAEILAAFMLDQLLTAPVAERHLAALRRRLFEPEARTLQGRVHARLGDAAQTHPEIARLARKISVQGEDTAQAMIQIARALLPWTDGRIEMATRDLDLHLSDVVSGDVSALVIEAPPGDEALCEGLFSALAGLAMMQLTDAAKSDNRGRAKTKAVLLILDDAALVPAIPLLARRMRDLTACGVSLIVKAAAMMDAACALGGGPGNEAAVLGRFETIASAGAQEEHTAQFLSDRAGIQRLPHLVPVFAGAGIWKYAGWLLPFPFWPKTPRLKSDKLRKLKPLQTLLLQHQAKSKLRMLEFTPPETKTTWRGEALPPVRHAWSAPPLPQPKTTLQRIRAPAAIARGVQTELSMPQPPEILPPGPFSPPPSRRKPRKNR